MDSLDVFVVYFLIVMIITYTICRHINEMDNKKIKKLELEELRNKPNPYPAVNIDAMFPVGTSKGKEAGSSTDFYRPSPTFVSDYARLMGWIK
jgi:hypothetical protein